MGREKPAYKAFLSYSRQHEDLAVGMYKIVSRLEDAVILDQRHTLPGANWRDEIEKAIKQCSDFYVIWCWHAAQSEVIEAEINLALQHNKTIIILCISEEPLPPRLNHINAVTELMGYCDLPFGDGRNIDRTDSLDRTTNFFCHDEHALTSVVMRRYREVTGETRAQQVIGELFSRAVAGVIFLSAIYVLVAVYSSP